MSDYFSTILLFLDRRVKSIYFRIKDVFLWLVEAMLDHASVLTVIQILNEKLPSQ